jgi:uncharacterized membrane protein YfcA
MAPVYQQSQKWVHLKSGVLAVVVGIAAAVVSGLTTQAARPSVAEFAFAFILTYTIAFGAFSKDGQL